MNDSDQPIVAVIDDDESVRESLGGLLETISVKVALFSSVEAFLGANPPVLPSCIVLDVRLPGASGFELQKQLVAADVDTPIVFITGHGDIPMSVRAMKAGAIEFLSKPFREQELLDAVRQGIERHRASEAQRRALQIRERFAGLTDREKEIMTLLARGRVSKQIAGQLGVSEVTVRVHRSQIMKKMGAGRWRIWYELRTGSRRMTKTPEPSSPNAPTMGCLARAAPRSVSSTLQRNRKVAAIAPVTL